MRKPAVLVALVTVACCLTLTTTSPVVFAQARGSRVALSAADQRTVSAFENRVREYADMRERLEERLPKLSKDAKPAEIERHKAAFQELVRSARTGAKQGDVFTPEAASFIRALIRDEYKGKERAELREEVLVEAENKAVPARVNYPYPETQELLEMPPTLLLRLPQLPKQVRYRFVRNNLFLVDRENGLIVDFMTDVLPKSEAKVQPAPASSGDTLPAGRAAAPAAVNPALKLTLPNRDDSVRFLVVGDTGTGSRQQNELARLMLGYRQAFPFEFALLMGDNMYGGEKAEDYKAKFEDVYKPLLDQKVKFYATLGNHDESNQRFYEQFNMNGEEYYNFKKGPVSFYALNSNYMDKKQLAWFEEKLKADTSAWKVAFFHHPPYSSGGKHGSEVELREVVEPLFVRYGVNVVLAGHEHFYERVKPQKGVYYFISGAGGKLRKGDVQKGSPLTAKAYDADMSFMLVEMTKDEMHFQVISRTGETVDSGVLPNQRRAVNASR
ncbi:MAG TPA: metallophosphoesterase [Pyrinomonadaceae bacterium]|jgi:hypothetical protein